MWSGSREAEWKEKTILNQRYLVRSAASITVVLWLYTALSIVLCLSHSHHFIYFLFLTLMSTLYGTCTYVHVHDHYNPTSCSQVSCLYRLIQLHWLLTIPKPFVNLNFDIAGTLMAFILTQWPHNFSGSVVSLGWLFPFWLQTLNGRGYEA